MKVLSLPAFLVAAAAVSAALAQGQPASEPPPLPPTAGSVYPSVGAAPPPEQPPAPDPQWTQEPTPAPAASQWPSDPAPSSEPPTAPPPAYSSFSSDAPPSAPPAAPPPVAPSAPTSDTTVVPAAPSVMGGRAPSAVEVGALGTLEGPVAGTLTDANGGLGTNIWNGVSRGEAETALEGLPPPSSPTARTLLRALLLTAASPPAGQAHAPFNAVRIRTLLDAGMVSDAAVIAAQVRAPKDADTSRAQADALLFVGDDAAACGDATAMRLDSDEQFWVELRAYCYALTKDPALDLTRAVLGSSDAAFSALLDGVISGKARAGVAFAHPTSLYVRMMTRLKLPMNAQVVDMGTPGALAALQSVATPKLVRIEAAGKLLQAGAISGADLSAALDLIAFKPADLAAAAAIARSEAPVMGLARLRAAMKREPDPTKRAELVYIALRIGVEQGVLYAVAPAFAADAAAIEPHAEWANWAPTYARAMLVAGRADIADRWIAAMRGSPVAPDDLIIAAAIATRGYGAWAAAQPALVNLAQRSMADPEGTGPRAALAFGLFDALGMMLPPEAGTRVQALVAQRWPGRRPTDATMQRVETASLRARRGEVALGSLAAIGRGPADLAPDVVVRLVRALQTAGVHDAAHALAREAVLAR